MTVCPNSQSITAAALPCTNSRNGAGNEICSLVMSVMLAVHSTGRQCNDESYEQLPAGWNSLVQWGTAGLFLHFVSGTGKAL